MMPRKRPRKSLNTEAELIAIYEDLANVDENIRITAAHLLVTEFVQKLSGDAEQISQILRRLIRGLCSGRKAARIGYAVALTEALACTVQNFQQDSSEVLRVDDLLRELQRQTIVTNNLSGQVKNSRSTNPWTSLLIRCNVGRT